MSKVLWASKGHIDCNFHESEQTVKVVKVVKVNQLLINYMYTYIVTSLIYCTWPGVEEPMPSVLVTYGALLHISLERGLLWSLGPGYCKCPLCRQFLTMWVVVGHMAM